MEKEAFGKELKSCFINTILVMILGFILLFFFTAENDGLLIFNIMFNCACVCGGVLRAIYLLYVYLNK